MVTPVEKHYFSLDLRLNPTAKVLVCKKVSCCLHQDIGVELWEMVKHGIMLWEEISLQKWEAGSENAKQRLVPWKDTHELLLHSTRPRQRRLLGGTTCCGKPCLCVVSTISTFPRWLNQLSVYDTVKISKPEKKLDFAGEASYIFQKFSTSWITISQLQ